MDEETVVFGDKNFRLDDLGCLMDFKTWRPDFAKGLAKKIGIPLPLTDLHMKVISYLRGYAAKNGRTPTVLRTCKDNGLKLRELEKLFPCGYHRCACKLAGLNFYNRYSQTEVPVDKVYHINAFGFLVDADQWDEAFAALRAEELGIDLTERHWEIIRFMRNAYAADGKVPTLFEVCHGCDLRGQELELLFPRGYHRCAVKVAGLSLLPS